MARHKSRSRFEIPAALILRGKKWRVLRNGEVDNVVLARVVLRAAKRTHALGKTLLGLCVPKLRVIWLNKHRSARAERSTFLHEAIHAASEQVISMKQEEKFISDIEKTLLSALEQLQWNTSAKS